LSDPDAKAAVAKIFFYKKRAKSVFYVSIYHEVLRSLKNMFCFSAFKGDFYENPFLLFFQKNADVSIFVEIQG